MMGYVNSINYDEIPLPYFVTLTYHRTWPNDSSTLKEQLKSFKKRLQRAFGGITVIWRMEYQKRGAPHFHLLLWLHDQGQRLDQWCESGPFEFRSSLEGLRAAVSSMWTGIVDPGNPEHLRAGTNVSKCRSMRHLNGYLSKYVAKVEPPKIGDQLPGKLWGKMHSDWLPVDSEVSPLSYEQFITARRWIRRLTGQRIYSPAPRLGESRHFYGMQGFVRYGTTNRMLAALGIIGTVSDEEGRPPRHGTAPAGPRPGVRTAALERPR